MNFVRAVSKTETPALERNILARAVLLFSGLILLISLSFSWFRIGGGSRGRRYELNGFRTVLRGFNVDFLSGDSYTAHPALTIGAIGVLLVVTTATLFLLLGLFPQRRRLRNATLLTGIATTLLPLILFLTTVYGQRIAGLQPSAWLIFITAGAGLCACITLTIQEAEAQAVADEDAGEAEDIEGF